MKLSVEMGVGIIGYCDSQPIKFRIVEAHDVY